MAPFIGQSTKRFEDARFLTGRGVFVDDVNVAGQTWAHVVRSPHAHATIDRIDTAAARAVPGRAWYLHLSDIADLGPVAVHHPGGDRRANDRAAAPGAGAGAKCGIVGDPVAFIVAETVTAARDAAERIDR